MRQANPSQRPAPPNRDLVHRSGAPQNNAGPNRRGRNSAGRNRKEASRAPDPKISDRALSHGRDLKRARTRRSGPWPRRELQRWRQRKLKRAQWMHRRH